VLRGTSLPILIFLRFFVFELRARTGQTDGQDALCGLYDGSIITHEMSTKVVIVVVVVVVLVAAVCCLGHVKNYD